MNQSQGERAVIWTARQRAALGTIIVAVALVLLTVALRWRVYMPEGSENGERAGELASKIDPNTASCTELAALPMIGETRAQAIVAYREAATQEHPDRPAFVVPADLMRVKGIGEKTVRDLSPWLVFPRMDDGTEPASQPVAEKNHR